MISRPLDGLRVKLDELTRQAPPHKSAVATVSRGQAIQIAQRMAPNMKLKDARLFAFIQDSTPVSIWVVDFDYRSDFTMTVIVDAVTGRGLYASNPPMKEPGN